MTVNSVNSSIEIYEPLLKLFEKLRGLVMVYSGLFFARGGYRSWIIKILLFRGLSKFCWFVDFQNFPGSWIIRILLFRGLSEFSWFVDYQNFAVSWIIRILLVRGLSEFCWFVDYQNFAGSWGR